MVPHRSMGHLLDRSLPCYYHQCSGNISYRETTRFCPARRYLNSIGELPAKPKDLEAYFRQFIVTYKDIVQDGHRAFRWNMYLNTACSRYDTTRKANNTIQILTPYPRPVEPTDEEMGPYCTSSTPGYVFDLHSLLVATEYGVEELWLDTLNITSPSEASQNVRLNQIHTVVPFIFYTMGAIDLAVFLLVSIRTSAGERHSNELSLAAIGVCLF